MHRALRSARCCCFAARFAAALFVLHGLGAAAAAQEASAQEASAQDPPAPHITSVHPDPLVGAIGEQWLTINGSGFAEGFAVRLQTDGVDALIDDRPSLRFLSAQQVQVLAVFGTEAVPWTVQVVNPGRPDSAASNAHTFEVVAPTPHIEVMRPIERTAGGEGFSLTVYGSTIAAASTLRWNGRELPTTPLRTSDNPNALTIGLKARVPAAYVAEAGPNQVQVYTPPPGGGLSPPMTLFANARPFYQTMWFKLLFVLGIVGAGYLMHWLRMKRYREKRLERQVAVRTRHLREEQQKTEAQAGRLRAQAEKLRRLDEAKSRFFANVSHEFRTPLTLIRGPLGDVLEGANGALSGRERRQLEVARRSAGRLEQLVGQFLDLSRLESGHLRLEQSRGDLAGFVEAVVHAHAPLAERRRVALQCCAAARRLEATFDPERLRTALDNLLSNALGFTPEHGRVVVTVAEAEGQAVIRVRDTGPGIPEAALPHLFERFYQADGSATRPHGGTGIGLSLAKDLVELHGGALRVESEEGEGAAFTIVLPLAGDEATGRRGDEATRRGWKIEDRTGHPETGALDIEDSQAKRRKTRNPKLRTRNSQPATPTILIVEDNAEVRAYLRRHLSGDYRLQEARDGREALERIRAERPDLVVSDVMMPGMDGAALCRTLKADDALSEVPVILLTARAGETERVKGLATGADDYVEKPFSVPELKARIRNLIASRCALRERYRREVVMQPTGVTVSSEDEAFYERARAAVERHIQHGNFDVGFFASEMDLSRSHLTRRLKAVTGLTPARFVQEMRLQRAAQLLEQNAGLHVYKVAEAVGYSNTAHFSRLFCEHFGAPPSAYPAEEEKE